MKQKKYSESKIKTTQEFLSRYQVHFDVLNERQKNIVVSLVTVRKLLVLSLSTLLLAFVVISFSAYIKYQTADSKIVQISKTSKIENEDALSIYGKKCFRWGFDFGFLSFVALLMLIYIILTYVGFKSKLHILDAFLPALKQPSDDNESSSN